MLSFKPKFMKKLPLLSHRFQKIGIILLVPSMLLGLAYLFWEYELPWLTYRRITTGIDFNSYNLTDEVASVGVITSLILIAFSKERTEDEAIQFFRLASLQWAVIANYIVLIACILLVYGDDFFMVMTYNMFTILIIFIVRFRFVLFQHNKAAV